MEVAELHRSRRREKYRVRSLTRPPVKSQVVGPKKASAPGPVNPCGGSKPMGSHFGVGEFTTHFRTCFSGDWDVHWGYDLGFECRDWAQVVPIEGRCAAVTQTKRLAWLRPETCD